MRALPLAFLLASTGTAGERCTSEQTLHIHIHIGAQTFQASVADTPSARQHGLSGRRELAENSGMWFEFPTSDWHSFWMQGMHFPIDLIWVSPTQQVLGVLTLQPCTAQPCPIFVPPGPVAHVLEINANAFAGRVGDPVTWNCTPENAAGAPTERQQR